MPMMRWAWWGDKDEAESTRAVAAARPPRRRVWRPAVEGLERRLCLSTTVAVPDSAGVAIPLPVLHAGDILTIRATLTSTDPNEDGESEPLVVQSSDGRSTMFSSYNVPLTNTFPVATDGVALTASFPEADEDDSAVLVVDVNRHDLLTQGTRDALWNAGHALVMGGLATEVFVQQFGPQIVAASPSSAPYIAALSAGNGLTLMAGWMTEQAASDAPATGFTTVAAPSFPPRPTQTTGGGLTQAAADAFNALATTEAQIYGLSRALLTALNREGGAFQTGDAASQAIQTQAVRQYAGRLAALFGDEAQYRTNLVAALSASPMPAQQLDPVDVLRSEQWVVDEGLPDALRSALQAMNADAASVDAIKGLLMVQSIRSFGGTFTDMLTAPSDLSALRAAAQQLQPLIGPAGGMTFQFAAPNFTVKETAGAVTVTVTRSGTVGPATVNYSTSNGTALSGKDYTATSRTLHFADGQASQTFTIPVMNAEPVPGHQTIKLALTRPSSGWTVGARSTALVTIQDVAPPAKPRTTGSGYGAGYDAFVITVFRETLGHDPTPALLLAYARAMATKVLRPDVVTSAIWSSSEHRLQIARKVALNIPFSRVYQDAVHAMSTGKPAAPVAVKR